MANGWMIRRICMA